MECCSCCLQLTDILETPGNDQQEKAILRDLIVVREILIDIYIFIRLCAEAVSAFIVSLFQIPGQNSTHAAQQNSQDTDKVPNQGTGNDLGPVVCDTAGVPCTYSKTNY